MSGPSSVNSLANNTPRGLAKDRSDVAHMRAQNPTADDPFNLNKDNRGSVVLPAPRNSMAVGEGSGAANGQEGGNDDVVTTGLRSNSPSQNPALTGDGGGVPGAKGTADDQQLPAEVGSGATNRPEGGDDDGVTTGLRSNSPIQSPAASTRDGSGVRGAERTEGNQQLPSVLAWDSMVVKKSDDYLRHTSGTKLTDKEIDANKKKARDGVLEIIARQLNSVLNSAAPAAPATTGSEREEEVDGEERPRSGSTQAASGSPTATTAKDINKVVKECVQFIKAGKAEIDREIKTLNAEVAQAIKDKAPSKTAKEPQPLGTVKSSFLERNNAVRTKVRALELKSYDMLCTLLLSKNAAIVVQHEVNVADGFTGVVTKAVSDAKGREYKDNFLTRWQPYATQLQSADSIGKFGLLGAHRKGGGAKGTETSSVKTLTDDLASYMSSISGETGATVWTDYEKKIAGVSNSIDAIGSEPKGFLASLFGKK